MEIIILSALSIIGLHGVVNKLRTFSGRPSLQKLREELDFKASFPIGEKSWHAGKSFEGSLKIKVLRFVLYPTILCRICMSSVWGTIFYWGWGWIYGGSTITGWIPVLFAIAGTISVMLNLRR